MVDVALLCGAIVVSLHRGAGTSAVGSAVRPLIALVLGGGVLSAAIWATMVRNGAGDTPGAHVAVVAIGALLFVVVGLYAINEIYFSRQMVVWSLTLQAVGISLLCLIRRHRLALGARSE